MVKLVNLECPQCHEVYEEYLTENPEVVECPKCNKQFTAQEHMTPFSSGPKHNKHSSWALWSVTEQVNRK